MPAASESDEARSFSYLSLAREPTLVAMMFVSFVVMFGYEIPAPILSSMAGGIGVSDARIGLVMTAFAVPSVLFVPVTGVLADIYGRRVVLVSALVVFASSGVAVAFVDSFSILLGLRVFQGLAFAGILPISVVVLGDTFESVEGSAAQGLRTSAAGAATVVVPPVAGYLAGRSWNVPFLLFAAVFPVAVAVFVFVPETGEALETEAGIVDTLARYASSLRAELADRDLGILVSGGFVRGFARLTILTFVPLFAVRVLDASLVEAGFVLSARGLSRLVLPPLSGVVTQRLSRKVGLLGAFTISAISCAFIPFAPSIVWVGVFVFGYTVGDSFVSPLLKDAVANHATDEHRGGVINSLYVLQNSGDTVAPAVFGVVLVLAGFDAVFLLTAAVIGSYVLAAVLFLDDA